MAKAVPSIPANIEIQIERWPIERLKPYEGNARTHSSAQINQIAASIAEFGWSNPILADAEDGIIAGHARLLAAQKLGMKEVPVIVLAHLNEAQRKVEMTEPRKALEAAGAETTLIAPEKKDVQGMNHDQRGKKFTVDQDLQSTKASEFDALLLPG